MRSCFCAALYFVLAFVLPATAGADPSLSLRLFTAIYQDDAVAITNLLAAGADPNVKVEYGITPLHIAAKWGHTSAIDSLLAGGANPNARKDRSVALFADGGPPCTSLPTMDMSEPLFLYWPVALTRTRRTVMRLIL